MTARTAPQVRWDRRDLLLGILAALGAVPVLLALSRIGAAALPGSTDPSVTAPLFAALAWFVGLVTAALWAFAQRRPLLGVGLLALPMMIIVAGAILYASLLAHPLRLPIGS